MESKANHEKKLQQVREGYTEMLKRSQQGGCGCGCGSTSTEGAYYDAAEVASLPPEAVQSSFGCGNPLKFTQVKEGQTVLDIGSGAGIDCFLAAQKVGPKGRVIGLDMTPAMIERAYRTARERGYANVEFRLGTADQMPVEDTSVDWIISNCVINLAPDKEAVFREAFRILKPGGRVAISDILLGVDLPPAVRDNIEAYVGCLAGAIREEEYLEGMRKAGFTDVKVTERLIYGVEQIATLVEETAETQKSSCCGVGASALEPLLKKFAGKVWSAQIEAVKPV